MKKEKVVQKLAKHYKQKCYARITRRRGGFKGISTGFILGMSEKFILIQESDDFKILGYQIFPIDTIKHVRYNVHDKTYEKILKKEGLLDQVELKYPIDLSDWCSLCKSVQKTGLTIISEREAPRFSSFCIGELKKVKKKSIAIRYFDARGIYDNKNTINRFKNITKISLDDHYANVFAKYTKERKK